MLEVFTKYCYSLSGELRGHGLVSANGGQGHSTSGGGSGGRIAVHTSTYNEYGGELLAYGETGTYYGDRGGPGTVFVEDEIAEFVYESKLYLDGRMLAVPKPVVVNHKNPRHSSDNQTLDNNADLNFDHLMLNNMVSNGQHL